MIRMVTHQRCAYCNGPLTSEDHKYCSDPCRESVRKLAVMPAKTLWIKGKEKV